MSDYQELVSILKELLLNRFYPKPYYIKGLLGDGRGNVLVEDRPDYNYARFNRSSSESFEVFNKQVSQPIDGLPILIGEFPWQPGLVQVVGVDWEAYSQVGWGDDYAGVQAHAGTHEWPNFAPGSDTVNTFLRAIVPLRAQAAGSGSNSVYVLPYEYDTTGSNVQWPGVPTVDFSTKPPTGTMQYMGVYLNPGTNQLGVVTGTPTVYTDAIEPPLPNWPLSMFPSAYIRIYGGQASISERDIRDARRLWNTTLLITGTSGGSPGGAAGGDLTGTYPNPRVVGLNSIPILGTPTVNQYLTFTGSAWRPTSLTGLPPVGPAGGDLTGSYPNPQVVSLKTIPIIGTPNVNDVLFFTGSAWRPGPIPASGGGVPSGPAGGDLTGTYPNPRVVGLNSIPIIGVPTQNQILVFTGSAWRPQSSQHQHLIYLPLTTLVTGSPELVWDSDWSLIPTGYQA